MTTVQATPDTRYAPATVPTMYFIGVTTGRSSIMKVFPRWAQRLGLGGPEEVHLRGIDCRMHDDPAAYRRIVGHIRTDPLTRGALVTTHKIDLLKACRGMFDELDDFASLMGEVSSISKRDGKLVGRAFDSITSGLSLEAFLPRDYWAKSGAECFVLGAGGSSIALTSHLMDKRHGGDMPCRIIVTNRSAGRLDEIRRIHDRIGRPVKVEYVHTPNATDNDAVMSTLKPGSVVVNATGLGKDAPGSPITAAAPFPQHGYAWDFNYRGDLLFLDQARAQKQARNLTIEDGWLYFIHGWTRVIAQVFDLNVATQGPEFEKLSSIAAAVR